MRDMQAFSFFFYRLEIRVMYILSQQDTRMESFRGIFSSTFRTCLKLRWCVIFEDGRSKHFQGHPPMSSTPPTLCTKSTYLFVIW